MTLRKVDLLLTSDTSTQLVGQFVFCFLTAGNDEHSSSQWT